MKILLDTNFLIDIVRFKIDLSELKGNELFLDEAVVKELKRISRRNSKDSASAKMALVVLQAKGLKVLKSKEKEADLSLLERAKAGYAVATQDLELKRKLRKAGAKIIYIRQKKYLVKE
jgi:rRNA-processing protein FCF1